MRQACCAVFLHCRFTAEAASRRRRTCSPRRGSMSGGSGRCHKLPVAMEVPRETRRYLDAALAACRRAGEIHRAHFRSAALRVELKTDASPVTVADRQSEEAIRETLRGATPELGLLGEEWWAARGEGAWAGTGTAHATCCQRRLRVSEVPALEQAFITSGGLKQFQLHGLWPALENLVARANRTRGFGDWWGHILVAEGRCDAMIEGRVALHEVAALKPILEEAGGVLL